MNLACATIWCDQILNLVSSGLLVFSWFAPGNHQSSFCIITYLIRNNKPYSDGCSGMKKSQFPFCFHNLSTSTELWVWKWKDQVKLIVPILQLLLLCMHVCRNNVMLRSWIDRRIDEWMMTSWKTDVHQKSEVLLNSLVASLAVCLLFCLTLYILANILR